MDKQPINQINQGLSRRYATDRRFRICGLLSVLIGIGFLLLMFGNIIAKGYSAFIQHYVQITLTYHQKHLQPGQLESGNYEAIVKDGLLNLFPWVQTRQDKRQLYDLVSIAASYQVSRRIQNNPNLVGQSETLWVLLDDDADMFFKGYAGLPVRTPGTGQLQIDSLDSQGQLVISGQKMALRTIYQALAKTIQKNTVELSQANDPANALPGQFAGGLPVDRPFSIELTDSMPSYFIDSQLGLIKLTTVADNRLTGVLYGVLDKEAVAITDWQLVSLTPAENDRRLSDKAVALLLTLAKNGQIDSRFNSTFFRSGDSREPEQSGIYSALKGSLYMLAVTLVLSFPIGIATAVYLEEFAPKNRWVSFIEININNLAAVPSIVFGLLGLAIFINFFGLPRSAPIVGGLVLMLMTLPTIIISSRAALKSVPPSIRQAALGIGASKVQTVFHHVLPLALPGMLTGTIIGMAQALGESAPLLMIGMVAFIADIPQGFFDPATALPVQIYLWADSPERAFVERTSAAIMVLLGFLISMNLIAVILRKRLEKRW